MSIKRRTSKTKQRLVLVEYANEFKAEAEQTVADIERKTGEAALAVPMGAINVRLGWL